MFSISIRPARRGDIPELQRLIAASVRGLQGGDYSTDQIEAAIAEVYGVDTALVDDGTYFAAEIPADETQPRMIVGCGGWSRWKTLFGGDQWHGRDELLLDPAGDAAKIRAFFVHPAWARRGIGTLILDACERAAIAAGFRRLEMASTLTGVKFYEARGYAQHERFDAARKRTLYRSRTNGKTYIGTGKASTSGITRTSVVTLNAFPDDVG